MQKRGENGCEIAVPMNISVHTHTPQLLGVATIVMVLEWQSHGLTVMDLTQGSFSYRDRFICFIAVACISSLYCTVMVAMGLGGLNIPPNLVSNFSY